MTNLQLSIIVPIYNVEQYLDDCLSSIYALEGVNYEVILVNDGSPDNSADIIKKFNNLYPERTVVINKKNGGLSAARNSGLNIAQGKYIALIDSDDYIDSKALFSLYQAAVEEDLDIATAQSLTFWKDSNSPTSTIKIPENILDLEVTNGIHFIDASFNANYRRINCWNKIYKHEFIKQHNLQFIEKLLFEDIPFTFEAFFSAQRVKAYPLDYYYYRQRPDSIMTSAHQKADPSRITIINHILNLLTKHHYLGSAFDDYLIYQLWENACGTKQHHFSLCKTFIKRRKLSIKGVIRLTFIAIGLPNLLSA